MWKQVASNPNYEVDETGRVRSRRRDNAILTPKKNHDGYLRIQLWANNRCRFVSIHRLVAEAFLEKPDGENIVVNHKNGIKDDNCVENLEWVTQQENIHHSWETGLSHHHHRLGKPVRMYSLNNVLLEEYPSMLNAQHMTGVPREKIRFAAEHNEPVCGYRWEVMCK